MIEYVTTKVHHWETKDIKSKCFDYCKLYTDYQITKNLGADAGIIPLFHDKNAMRDFSDENGLWEAYVAALKSKVTAKDLDMNRHLTPSSDSHETVNMSRFLQ